MRVTLTAVLNSGQQPHRVGHPGTGSASGSPGFILRAKGDLSERGLRTSAGRVQVVPSRGISLSLNCWGRTMQMTPFPVGSSGFLLEPTSHPEGLLSWPPSLLPPPCFFPISPLPLLLSLLYLGFCWRPLSYKPLRIDSGGEASP